MSALVSTSQGASYARIPRPLPAPGEVVIRVSCAGLCRTDIYAGSGQMGLPPGRVLGHEFSGIVVCLGAGVDSHLSNRRVAVFPWLGCGECAPCRASLEGHARCAQRQQLGVHRHGAFASEIAVPGHRLLPCDDIEDRAAAYAEPVAAALGVHALVPEGAEVAVFGDNRIGELTGRLLEASGRRVVEATAESELSYAVEASADPRTIVRAMRALRPGGTLVVKSRPADHVLWPLRLQVEKELLVVGAGYGSFAQALDWLREKGHLFADLWEEPVPLARWPELFEHEQSGAEARKAFFLPEPVA